MWRPFKLKIATAVLAGILAVLVLFVTLLHTPTVRRYALKQAIQILAREGVDLEASQIDYNLLTLTATLGHVTVRSRQTPDLPPVAEVDRLRFDLDPRKLLHGAFYVRDAEIANPKIHVVVDEKGRDNLPHPPEEKESPETDYLVEKLRLSGGSLRFEERRQQIDASLPLWQVAIDGNLLTKDHTVRLETRQPGQIAFQQRTLPVQSITAEVALQKNAADVHALKLVLGESIIAFSGRLNNFKDPNYDFKAETDLALGSLTRLAGIPQKISGTVHASLTATGPLAQMRATARLDGRNLTIERFSSLSLKSEAVYDAAAQRVQIESLNMFSPAGAIRGKGSVALNTKVGDSTLNVALRELDLERLSNVLKLPVRIASRASGEVAAHWPALDFGKAAGDASLNLAATQHAQARDTLPVSGALNMKSPGNRVVIGISSLDALNAHVKGQITLVNQRALSGEIQVDAPDVAGTVAGAEGLLGRKLVETTIAGVVSAQAKLGGTLQNPTAEVTVASNGLQAGTLTGIALNAAVNYTPAELAIRDSVVKWQNQQITASGTVGLKGAEPPISLAARTSTLSIPTLLEAAGRKDIPAAGSLTIEANVGGTTKEPRAQVNVNASDLAVYAETVGALTAQAELAGRIVTVQKLHVDKPQPGGNGTLDASGSYNIDSKEYTVDLASKNIRLASLTLPDGSRVRAALDLQAQGHGSADNPAGNAKLSADNVEYRDQQFGSVRIRASLANQQVDFDAAAPKFNLTAKANVGVKEPNPITFEVTANNTDLQSLPLKLELPVTGTVTATLRGSGEIKNYEQGRATAEVAKLNLAYNGQPIRTEGPLAASYQDKMLTIDHATLLARDSRISVDGKLPLNPAAGPGAINIDGTLNLDTLRAYLPLEQSLVTQGTANIKGTLSGTLKEIDPNLSISLDKGYISGGAVYPPIADLTVRAQARNGALEVERLAAGWGPATFQAAGQVPFGLLPADLPVTFPRRQGPAQFTAQVNEIDLSVLEGTPKDMTGAVSLRLEAQVPRPDIEAVTAKITSPTLRVGMGTYNLQQSVPSTISVANGIARVEQFQLTGPNTDIRLAGTAGLTGAKPVDLRLDGKLDAAIAGAFTQAVRARGATEVALAVTGTVQNPQTQGHIQLSDAQVNLQSPRIGIEGLNTRIDLAGNRATLSRLEGTLNGGTLSGGGSFDYADGQFKNTNLNIQAKEVYVDYPEGLKTVSNINLNLRNTAANLVVGGEVVVVEGGFTDDLNIDRGILAAVTAPRGIEVTEERNPQLQKVRFNVAVRTDNPIYVKNNLAKAEIDADLKLLGNPYDTGLSGRLSIEEGSELTFNERKYTVERGNIQFTSERRIEPNLDIEATTTASGFNITLRVTGAPGKTETTLTSDPPLPEQDILAVLLTGKKLDEIRGQEFEIARTEVLSYVTGRIGSSLGSKVAGATGLSTVRIEPSMIATEANPSARLTVGQEISPKLNLIYSMNLIDSSDQIYIGEFDVTRRFTTRGTRQSDGSFRGDFQHNLLFGGLPDPKKAQRRENRRIARIDIQGITYFPEEKIASKLKVKEGQKYDFFKVRKGVDRIDKMYVKEGLLEASVRLKREPKDESVSLTLKVDAGPKVDFVFEGAHPDGGVQKRVRDIWHGGVFDSQRAEESMQAIRAWLVKEGNLRPKVDYKINKPADDRETVVFDIQPGPKFSDVKIEFEGAHGIDPKTLRKIIEDQKLSQDVYVKPGRVTELLARYYQEQGYLDAKIQNPRDELNPETRTGKVVFPVEERSLYTVAHVEFQGATVFTQERLKEAAPLTSASEYRPALREQTVRKIRELYWGQGYNDAEVEMTTRRRAEAGELDAVVRINEGRQSIAREIVVEGNDKTSENLIRTQIEAKPGEILTLQMLANSRRNLYNTGAFSLVEINSEEVATSSSLQSAEQSADHPPVSTGQKPVRLTVRVWEVQPFEFKYGGFYDTERGPGAIAEITNRNSLGSARTLGLRTRYDSQLKEARLYFTQPLLQRFRLSTTASPYIRRENNPATSTSDAFNVDRVGFSIQQEAKFRNAYVLNYGYRIEKSRTYDAGPEPIFDIPLRIASLTSTLSRETRDDVLDATRGQFLSHAFQFSPELLGSELRFIKYFGQYFRYFALQKPKVQLFTNQVLRPRLVFATGVRVGLAKGFGGQEIPLSERFFAGGSTTIRGFEQNSVGDVGPGRIPLGGDGMLVINNEIRFPLIGRIDGVGFVDIGNVYPKISDFSLTDIRKAAGVGLRLRTPWFLLRLDYGVKLDRREGESRGRIFFSIGQAF